MAVARIRTSDPEVVEFLSRHLAASGYHLEFVRPGEAVQGEPDLEIDATRMDLASAMAQAQLEPGLVTILQGVLRAEPKKQPVQTEQPVRDFSEYADVSPYAQGAELEDEPSKLQQAAQATGNALVTGLNTLGEVTKTTSSRFGAWKAQRDAARAARREQRERDMAVAAAHRREQEARRAEEESRRRAEEERQAAIRREERARMQAEEQRRREEQARVQAEAAQRQAQEDRRLQAEAAQRRAEQEARQRADQERRRAEELAASGIERQHQEELRLAQQRREAEEQRIREEQEELRHEAAASREESVAESEAATVEDAIAEPQWEQAEARLEPEVPLRPIVPAVSKEHRSSLAPVSWNRPSPTRRISRQRERVFRRAGVAAAIVAAGVISVWSISSLRRPANPLNTDQLRRSVIVDQQRPFGPATAAAPVARPSARPSPRPAAASRKLETRKPTARARSSRTRATKTRTAEKVSDDPEPEVTVRHFATQPPATAKVKVREKDGVKIISEN